ncbi:MAG TPA: hypothetical protein VGK67_01075 [Myxococcales bacterium]|jgi:hypothetical protein
MTWDPEDAGLREAEAVLEPTRPQIARMQEQVEERVEREGVPLLDEWLGLARARPLANGGLALAAALALLLTTPFGAMLWAIVRGAAA